MLSKQPAILLIHGCCMSGRRSGLGVVARRQILHVHCGLVPCGAFSTYVHIARYVSPSIDGSQGTHHHRSTGSLSQWSQHFILNLTALYVRCSSRCAEFYATVVQMQQDGPISLIFERDIGASLVPDCYHQCLEIVDVFYRCRTSR